MTLKELENNEHPYYGSGTFNETYDTFESFFDGMKGYDIDLNLCYRWDVKKIEDTEGEYYYAEIFTILQRKGVITSHYIESFTESDIPLLEEYLRPHIDKLKEIWLPFKF